MAVERIQRLTRKSFCSLRMNIGHLLLRAGAGGMMLGWGVDKMLNFTAYAPAFPDPFGAGREVSLGLTALAQGPFSLFVVVGCFTRLSAMPPLICMLVAAFIVHRADPWSSMEHALLYAVPFAALTLTGAGRFSVDALLNRGSNGGEPAMSTESPLAGNTKHVGASSSTHDGTC